MSLSEDKKNEAVETVVAVLKSGNSVELKATGYSMFPSLRPGDRILVSPVRNSEDLKPGCIIVFRDNSGLIVHRIAEIRYNSSGENVLITRGDSMKENDTPLAMNQVIGVATGFRRKNKEHSIRNIAFTPRYYRFNRLVLWLYFRTGKFIRNFYRLNRNIIQT